MEHNIYVHHNKEQGRIVVRKSQNCTRDIEDLFSLFHPVVEIPYCVHFNGWRGFSKARYESLMLHVSLLDIGEGVLNTHFFLSKYHWLFRMEQSRVETQSICKDVKGKIKFFLQKKVTYNSHPKSGLKLTPDIHQLTNVLETQWDKKRGKSFPEFCT